MMAYADFSWKATQAKHSTICNNISLYNLCATLQPSISIFILTCIQSFSDRLVSHDLELSVK